jgi:uncharacterized damage-inducible protein DinB
MNIDVTIDILTSLTKHNQWANKKVFDACSTLNSEKLNDDSHGYESVLSILNHLVRVEHSFFELAHGREPQRIQHDDLNDLHVLCAKIDHSYIDYVSSLTPKDIEAIRFLVPWFGFEISIIEGIIQPMTHSHKHRSDVSMILPLLGAEGIEMDFILWIADQKGVIPSWST